VLRRISWEHFRRNILGKNHRNMKSVHAINGFGQICSRAPMEPGRSPFAFAFFRTLSNARRTLVFCEGGLCPRAFRIPFQSVLCTPNARPLLAERMRTRRILIPFSKLAGRPAWEFPSVNSLIKQSGSADFVSLALARKSKTFCTHCLRFQVLFQNGVKGEVQKS